MTKSLSKFYLFLIPVLVTVSTIWLPIGISELPQVEEWQLFSVFQNRAPVFWVTTGDFEAHRLRPLFLFLDAVVYSTPVPYLSMHALLALALIVKGLAMAYVAHWLTGDRLISVIASAIFILHPADTMQMGFRSLVIIWPVALSFSAIGLLLASTDADKFPKRIILSVAAAISMLVAGLMYEAALTMAVAPLVLMLAKFGSGAFGRLLALWRQSLIWLAAITANLLYIVLHTGSGRTYQGALLEGAPPLSAMPGYLVETGLYRVLLQCWYDGLLMFSENLTFVPYLLGALVACILSYIALRGIAVIDRMSVRMAARTLLAGIFLAALGYAPFLISTPHIHISQRTYLFASIGGSIFVIAVLIFLRRSKIALAALAAVLIASGFGSQWEQLAHYSEISSRQSMYLSNILAAAPDAAQKPVRTLLITDRSGSMSNTWMLRGENLPAALSYIYGKPVRAALCAGPSEIFSSFTTDQYGTPGRCVATNSGWEIGKGAANAFELTTAATIHLVIRPDGSIARLTGTAPPPDDAQIKRAQSILGCFPCTLTPRVAVGASFRADFGKWWSLDAVPWGGGWADASWIIPPAMPVSYSWMIAPTSNLFFKVVPEGSDYSITVRIVGSVSSIAKDSLSMSINGEKVDAKWLTPNIYSGTVKSSVFSGELNELRLESILEKQFSVSNQVDWIEVAPIKQSP